jgi:hypothetical protein
MATAPAHLSFLPWVRQGAAAAIAARDTLGNNMRGAAELNANLSINGTPPQSVALRLRGPADVVGIDARQIVRMDPHPGAADFEPNYFAGIEFDRADFPWLFTPASATVEGKLRPWLCLVVVRVQPGVSVGSTSDAPLPVLDIAAPALPGDELPDLSESWAWAHAQAASGGGTPADVRNALGGRPELALSRLLCPRLLVAHTDYLACVVPTFELGVKAGLGQDIKDTDLTAASGLKPAWSLTPTPPVSVRLPVYHQWRFRTGDQGDFESLVRLLRALPAPAGLGTRPIDVSQPGFRFKPPADPLPAGTTLALEGALKPLTQGDLPAGWTAGQALAFQIALADIVNAPGLAQTIDPSADPLLAPPLYGRWHAERTTVTRAATPWLDEINLDPRHRVVAALGTRVIQEHQEALMAAAWEQAAELQRANQRLRQLQLSLVVGTSLHARHLARLSDEAALRFTAPAYSRLRAVTNLGAGVASTLVADLRSSPLPLKATSAAMRRIGRERGPLTRRVAAQGGTRSMQTGWVTLLNTNAMSSFVAAPRWDVAGFNVVRQRVAQPATLAAFSSITAEAVTGMRGRPVFQIVAEGLPVTVQGVNNVSPALDSPTARSFRLAASAHLARINPGRLGMLFAPPPPLNFVAVRAGLQTQLEPRRTLAVLANVLVKSGGNATPAVNPVPAAPVPIETIMAAPKFRQPMYEPLRDLSQDLLLPRLDMVQPNTVLGLQTNRRFIEAYMVGLNFEMARELLWRGYPTDQRGTYFDQFWDANRATDPLALTLNPTADIFPLHQWGNRRLGDAASAPALDRFVMLLRSDLLRRYPSAMIYAAKAVVVNGVRVPSTAAADESMPVFRGTLPPDVSFFGFSIPIKKMVGLEGDLGYFIVIQEQPGEPRFGLDDDTPRGTATHLRVAAGVPAGLPLNGLQWGLNAAHMAGVTRQQPVRVAIHASKFLP